MSESLLRFPISPSTSESRRTLALQRPLGTDYRAEPGDIVNAKSALMALGYYRPVDGTEPGAWVDTGLFDGIRAFQQDSGLKVDGLMRPGGPTEAALNAALDGQDATPAPDEANDNRPPANENEPGWDEASKWKGRRGPWWKRGPDKGPIENERRDDKPIVPGGPKPSTCETLFELDIESCRRRYPFPTDKPGFVICESEAQKNYADCLGDRNVYSPQPGGRRSR